MKYKIGEQIKLWVITPSKEGNPAFIEKEVTITISEINLNVKGEFSRETKEGYVGYKAIGDDGKEYEQFWFSYPEGFGATSHFWNRFYDYDYLPKNTEIDMEPYFNSCVAFNDSAKQSIQLKYRNNGNKVVPFGSNYEKCENHDYYHKKGSKCLLCLMNK